MIIERQNFIIELPDNIDYITEVLDFLEREMKTIMDFFELKKFYSKKRIVIWDDIEKYQKHIEKYSKFEDWMCADTMDGNINMLSVEECVLKTKAHYDMTVEEFKRNILHEFVHICQSECEIDTNHENNSWFYEALATNLADPQNKSIVTAIVSAHELVNHIYDRPDGYNIMYTIGKYLLENYPHDKILEYVRYPKTLTKDIDKILNDVTLWLREYKGMSF